MCDYSLHGVASRPAKVGDKLTTRNFGTGTRGFSAPEERTTAVCLLPGTEIAFASEIAVESGALGNANLARRSRVWQFDCTAIKRALASNP